MRKASALARTALTAANQQTVRLPAEDLTAGIVAELAGQVLDLDQRIDDLDEVLNARLRRHPQAKILTSLPGIGVLLAAEFLVAVGTWPASPAPTTWPPTPDWRRSRGIRVAAAAPCADPSATTASCCASSTSLP